MGARNLFVGPRSCACQRTRVGQLEVAEGRLRGGLGVSSHRSRRNGLLHRLLIYYHLRHYGKERLGLRQRFFYVGYPKNLGVKPFSTVGNTVNRCPFPGPQARPVLQVGCKWSRAPVLSEPSVEVDSEASLEATTVQGWLELD